MAIPIHLGPRSPNVRWSVTSERWGMIRIEKISSDRHHQVMIIPLRVILSILLDIMAMDSMVVWMNTRLPFPMVSDQTIEGLRSWLDVRDGPRIEGELFF